MEGLPLLCCGKREGGGEVMQRLKCKSENRHNRTMSYGSYSYVAVMLHVLLTPILSINYMRRSNNSLLISINRS